MIGCATGRTSSNANSLCYSWTGSKQIFHDSGEKWSCNDFLTLSPVSFCLNWGIKGWKFFFNQKKQGCKMHHCQQCHYLFVNRKFVESFMFIVHYVMVVKVARKLYKGLL